MRGEWLRKPKEITSVVFVHGILSSGDACWLNGNGTYWPELLKNEEEFNNIGIYVYSYETGYFSGNYSLNDIVDDLKERLINLDGVLDSRQIVFVCHSMGGIIVRKFIVERVSDLLEKKTKIGLFLVASPSLGSSYANLLGHLAKKIGNTQADVLRFEQNNIWLNGLDKEFQNLISSGKVEVLGKELVEDKFLVFSKFFSKQIVEPFSGARYFGESYKVPNSDHFSIAKPGSKEADQHRLLCKFIRDFLLKNSKNLFENIDNTHRDKIIKIFYGKGLEYKEILKIIKELKDDISDIPESKREKRENKLLELKKAEESLIEFKVNLREFYTSLAKDDKVVFNEIFGRGDIDEADAFFEALKKLKEAEQKLSHEQKQTRRNHFDYWSEYMKSLPEGKLFEQQKRDSLNYLNRFNLSVINLKRN